MTGQASTTTPPRRRSFASSGLSYWRVAEELGVRLCSGLDHCPWYKGQHRSGMAFNNEIHWTPRRMTRRGLYRFLLLVAQARVGTGENFERLYDACQLTKRYGQLFGVRFPHEYSARERARARLWLEAWRRSGQTDAYTDRAHIRRIRAWARP